VFTHEAAHAVAATQRGIRFVDVRILAPTDWLGAHDGLMLGGVTPRDEPRTWVPLNPLSSLEFVLAGSVAERGAFGHCLEGAYLGDISVWRTGAGLTAARDGEKVDSQVGKPLASVVSDVELWVTANWPMIRRVAGALAGVPDLSEAVMLDFKEGWTLTEAEVLALVG
jgi:hypothetical protein